MLRDYFSYVLEHLMKRRLRSWLTLLGIFIGMAAVVALVSLSQGLQDAVTEQYVKIGADRIMVQPAGAVAGPFSAGLSAAKLTDHDVNIVGSQQGIEFVAGLNANVAQVKLKDEVIMGYIMGTPTDSRSILYMEKIGLYTLESGRPHNAGAKYEAVMGNDVATKAFSRNVTTRDKLVIMGKEFDVVGIEGSGVGFSGQGIRIPKDTARELFGLGDENAIIMAKVAAGYNPSDVAEQIRGALRRAHNVKVDQEDFVVETSEDLIKSFLEVLGIIQVLIVGVAAISLVVGGVGIMNTMYTAVVERTKEIGIMKAIGARNRDILTIFILESGFLGFLGGAIGVVLGLLISKTVEVIAGSSLGVGIIRAHISASLILGVLAFAFSLGILAGYFPAKKASRMLPVDALRR